MKILLIAYDYPPIWNAQSIRWYYLSKELANLGFKIDVLTVKYPGNHKIDFPQNIRIYKVFPGPIQAFYFRFRQSLKVDEKPRLRNTKMFQVLKIVNRLIMGFLKNILPGDIRTEWFPFAVNFIKKNVDLKNYDVLITSHEPYVDSLIGLFLKKQNTEIKWIADIADPFTTHYYPRWRKKIDELFEKTVLSTADRILVTSEQLKKEYIKKYGIEEEKILLIRQGFDLRNVFKEKRNSKFTFAYTGVFYKNCRDPDKLFSALEEIDFDFNFIIAGRNEEFLPNSSIREKIEFLGFIPHFKVLDIQEKADLLIHLTYKNQTQVPGKFFEYLGSGTPILCITYNENDETALLTKKLNVGIVCKNKKDSIKKSLIEIYTLWKSGKIKENFNLNPNNFREYSWQALAEKIAEAIQK